jgi:inhibitor of cysteine peptidase
VTYVATGKAKGHILNQFAMDEHDGYFRIATTISGYVNNRDTSTNNVYVLDSALKATGALEDVAPGESIYAVRFMGKRAYMVTFLHVDPLFVIDLSQPAAPRILGKLKIPGYSDYLHPYDETHLIGIGKEVDASIDANLVHTENAVYYTAIQGVKLALFDVKDVANPIEVYKEVIGDRGTESLAAQDHKAFLFDKEKGLLVIPVTLAELKPGQPKNMQGEYVFQGAYVYNLTLKNGFNLKGKVTHYDTTDAFQKSGQYFYGGQSDITRSLYINNVLYTLSQSRLQLNDLASLANLRVLPFDVK